MQASKGQHQSRKYVTDHNMYTMHVLLLAKKRGRRPSIATLHGNSWDSASGGLPPVSPSYTTAPAQINWEALPEVMAPVLKNSNYHMVACNTVSLDMFGFLKKALDCLSYVYRRAAGAIG